MGTYNHMRFLRRDDSAKKKKPCHDTHNMKHLVPSLVSYTLASFFFFLKRAPSIIYLVSSRVLTILPPPTNAPTPTYIFPPKNTVARRSPRTSTPHSALSALISPSSLPASRALPIRAVVSSWTLPEAWSCAIVTLSRSPSVIASSALPVQSSSKRKSSSCTLSTISPLCSTIRKSSATRPYARPCFLP